MSDLPFEKILQIAMRYGADFAEVFSERTRGTTIVCDDKRLEKVANVCDAGVGIRVISGDRIAYGSTNDLTHRSLFDLARQVGRSLRAKRSKVGLIILSERSASSVATIERHPFGIPLEEKCGTVLRANDIVWKLDEQIKQAKILYKEAVRRIEIATSDGRIANDEQVDTIFTAQIIASDGKILQTGYETLAGAMGFEIFDTMLPEEVAERAAKRALKMLKARPAPAGQMPVILSAEAGGTMIHEAVGHGLEADLAKDGLSVYSGKLGEKVASELVSVVDDGTLPGKRGSITFDDEGTPAQRTVLIENGVLKSYLSNHIASGRNGHPLTGNSRRQSYEFPPIVRMTNTLILSGKDNPSDVLKETQTGLFVKRMGGGQVNTINGDFVFDVQEGCLIENGKLGDTVRGATLVGNGPKVLLAIDRVCCDLGFSVGTCGKEGQEVPVSCGQPTIRIPSIVVGGTEKR